MGRPIGYRIVEATRAVSCQAKACSARDVARFMTDVQLSNVSKYCDRAVGHGLMTVDTTVYPRLYSVVPGWQEVVAARHLEKLAPPLETPAPAEMHAAPVVMVATALANRSPLEQAWAAIR